MQTAANRLRLARRDPRVSVGRQAVRLQLPPSRAAAFAQALIDRYAPGSPWWPVLGLVFTQSAPGVTLRPVLQHHALYLAPRLNLTFLASLHGPQSPQPDRVWQGQRITTHEERTVQRLIARTERVVQRLATREQQLVTRLVAREERAEIAAPKNRPVVTCSVAAPRIDQDRVAAGVPRRTTAGSLADQELASAARPAGAGQPLATLPPADVSRLADQVIQAIDRRIIAQRERLGRI